MAAAHTDKADVSCVMHATYRYRAILDGLEEQQRIEQEHAARKAASAQAFASEKAAAIAEAVAEATARVQLPPVPPPPPQPAPPKLPLSYTYCFHPAADTWVPATRAATAAAPARTKPAKAPVQRQQEAGGRSSNRTNCHATAGSLWISTPRTYSYDAAAGTWVLSAAPPAAPANTTAQELAAAAAAAKGGSGIGGGCSMRYSHFTGGWLQTQPAADAELPVGAKQRCARCTYCYDAASDAWVCGVAPVAAAAKAMAAPAAGGSCSAASHLCTVGGWLPASSKVYSFDVASNTWALPDDSAATAATTPASPGSSSVSAAAHIPTADGWLPAPPTYSFDPASGTWAMRPAASAAAAATAAATAAPAAPTTLAADSTTAVSAYDQAAAAVAFAQAPSPPAFLAFARRGSPCSRAAAAEAAAGAAAIASALSPPAALAFTRRGSPTSRATPAAAAKPAAAQAILLPPPPPPPQHDSRTYAYDAARDAWFCPTLDYVSPRLRCDINCVNARTDMQPKCHPALHPEHCLHARMFAIQTAGMMVSLPLPSAGPRHAHRLEGAAGGAAGGGKPRGDEVLPLQAGRGAHGRH